MLYVKSLDHNLPNMNGGFVIVPCRSTPVQR